MCVRAGTRCVSGQTLRQGANNISHVFATAWTKVEGMHIDLASGGLPRIEDLMQMAITFMAVVGGMVLSLAVALVADEFIFGQVFRLFFSEQAAKTEPKQ